MTAVGPLPVTVVGGYLGAGKTTLVNSLLRQANGRRLAIMVNEFGALPIDASLVEAADDRIVSLVGGCVCCSYGEDLVSSLVMLEALEPRPDHVLLEASGVAFPGAIAGTVGLLQGFALDGAVVLADAETVRGRAGDRYLGSTVRRQIEQADLILLNKCDLADDADEVEAWLGEAAPDARLLRTVRSDAPIDIVLGAWTGRPAPPAAGGPFDHTQGYTTGRARPARGRRTGGARPHPRRPRARPAARQGLHAPPRRRHGRHPDRRQPLGRLGRAPRRSHGPRLHRPRSPHGLRRPPAGTWLPLIPKVIDRRPRQ